MSQAQNNLQNAIIDNQRYENAFKTGGVTKQQLDNSRLQLKNAQAAVTCAKRSCKQCSSTCWD